MNTFPAVPCAGRAAVWSCPRRKDGVSTRKWRSAREHQTERPCECYNGTLAAAGNTLRRRGCIIEYPAS